VVDHYTGRYLDDLEALWAESARLRCEDTFLSAAETLLGRNPPPPDRLPAGSGAAGHDPSYLERCCRHI